MLKCRELIERRYFKAGFLASYPRSGSAMVRMALHGVYGQETSSIYKEDSLGPLVIEALGHTEEIKDGVFYRTHEKPTQKQIVPCIIVVRDPRDVFPSLQRLYRERNRREYSMEEIILGQHPYGDWSDWVHAWMRYMSNSALWVRYETFRAEAIGEWASLEKSPKELPSIDELKKAEPTLFGPQGGQRSDEYESLIWSCHGSTMSMLGYER